MRTYKVTEAMSAWLWPRFCECAKVCGGECRPGPGPLRAAAAAAAAAAAGGGGGGGAGVV